MNKLMQDVQKEQLFQQYWLIHSSMTKHRLPKNIFYDICDHISNHIETINRILANDNQAVAHYTFLTILNTIDNLVIQELLIKPFTKLLIHDPKMKLLNYSIERLAAFCHKDSQLIKDYQLDIYTELNKIKSSDLLNANLAKAYLFEISHLAKTEINNILKHFDTSTKLFD